MFPSKLFSTGGDELNTNCYSIDQPTQDSLKASGRTLEQALDVFTQETHKALEVKGKTPVVWEEMVLDNALPLKQDTPVLVWISSENVAKVAAKGYRVIHAASDFFYLVSLVSFRVAVSICLLAPAAHGFVRANPKPHRGFMIYVLIVDLDAHHDPSALVISSLTVF